MPDRVGKSGSGLRGQGPPVPPTLFVLCLSHGASTQSLK